MIVSIHQPGYLPWHGYFHRLALSDVHILLDTAQFEKNGFNNRVKIRNHAGEQWLTVPVRTKGKFGLNPLNETEIDPTARWATKHWATLQQAYARAPGFAQHAPFFERMYSTEWSRLLSLNVAGIEYLVDQLGIGCRLITASSLNATGQRSDLILHLCLAVGATTYISGINGRDYLDRQKFKEAGIEVRFQAYREPRYDQLHGEFRPYMSAVDLLFNHGPNARAILLDGHASLSTGSSN